MSRPLLALLALAALLLVSAAGAGGYLVGQREAPSNADAAAERAAARRAVLANAEAAAKREQQRARQEGVSLGKRRGRRAGAAAGKKAGETEVANSGVGPTPLPAPLVPADAYAPQLTGGDLTDKPSEIILGNHSQLEGITWSEWGGDVAVGSGTLFRIVNCEPSCAEDPGERLPATVKAWEPTFNPDNVRYYSKLTIEPSAGDRFTMNVAAF
jgi:hypothetical protein